MRPPPEAVNANVDEQANSSSVESSQSYEHNQAAAANQNDGNRAGMAIVQEEQKVAVDRRHQ